MATFFTSDTHFNHENIIRYCNRPFSSKREMTERLVYNWNRKVSPEDTVYHVGDVGFGNMRNLKEVLLKLNGIKHLVLGNHDREEELIPYFQNIYRLVSLHIPDNKINVVLCHYPIESWPGMRHNVIHLHGHCHGALDHPLPNRMDVGVDCHPKFEPWSVPEILKHLKEQNDAL